VPPPLSDGGGNDPIPELTRLGDLLTKAREGADLSREALAERLRIEPRLLKALEEGDHGQLPEGVFVVAMARRIAGSLHADLDEAIADVRHSRLMSPRPTAPTVSSKDPGPSGLAQAAPSPAPRRPRPASAPRASKPWLWPLAALLATIAGAAGWLALSQRTPGPSAATAPSPSPAVPPSRPQEQPPGSAAIQPPGAPAQAPAPSPMEADTLRLKASEPSWVEVRDSEGKTVFEGTLTGEKRFSLGRGLRVMAGRPYAVNATIGAGPSTALGGVEDIRWSWFRPGGLQPEAPPSSSPTP